MKYIYALIIFFIPPIIFAEEVEYKLLKNPFVKPGFIKESNTDNKKIPESTASLSEDSLRATLSAGSDSIANVNGQMIFIGDKVNGYKLISVDVGSATFVRNGKEITLNVSEMHKKLR